ncbi:MAG: transcription-repair coupling factor [Oscillospiraceae bacterium]|nr:transcription-repair coupling factor [Oscillospiraceae bacterium]
MENLIRQLLALPQLRELTAALSSGTSPAQITGLSPVHRAQITAALRRATARPVLMVCADEKDAARQAADLRLLTGEDVTVLHGREWHLHTAAAVSRSWEYKRLASLYAMSQGTPVTVTTVEALVQRCIPPSVLAQNVHALAMGETYDLPQLTERLIAAGYTRSEQVEGPGQFALRGGILDVFSPGAQQPVRCEFFGDEVDSLGWFDVSTQRRTRNCERALLLPAGEVLPCPDAAQRLEQAARRLKGDGAERLRATLQSDAEQLRQGLLPPGTDRYMSAVYPEFCTALDYLPSHTLIVLSDSPRVGEALRGFLWQLKEDVTAAMENGLLCGAFADLTLGEVQLQQALGQYAVAQLDSLPTSRCLLPPKGLWQINAKQLSSYGGSLDTAATDMTHYLTVGYRCMVLCGGEVRGQNLYRLLTERGIPAALDFSGSAEPEHGCVLIGLGAISAGSEYPELKLAVLTEGQLTSPVSGKSKKVRSRREDSHRKIQSYTDLTPGDLVVHVHHGIGRFAGVVRLNVDGVEKDYIKITYAGTDCLYVPCTALDLVSKYIGSGGEEDGKPVRLNKLGGSEWAKTTYRAKAAARDLAKGLITLYAERQRLGGYAFSPDSPWQREFEDSFEYEETDDQLTAAAEIKADMEKAVPMDRLLCGDVGYGKTEVALRAVMKCIMDGKQAALLVPTTVLAQQHYATAVNRFRSFPVTIEVLSRFRSGRQLKDTLERTKRGKVDLLIGTHKLLQKNVEFRDLGLLIIDEEQRFGVAAKEQLRRRSRQVDTLTLSATPIPRTLNMALSGIRDMSTIEQPPQDRQSVQTYVLEYDRSVVLDAIRRELGRGGQVYYLHNRVENIDSSAAALQRELGEDVVVATAHGKMPESELSRVMQQMSDGDIQVLVCTTIIETGIDIPNVNTLIIEDADRMGLSQLHQIRGRIGRSPRRAYAYLTYRAGKVLSEVAAKRLSAIREYVEFGSGFKIAMRDLEIRGAGNLLGPEQSGYMMSVGYDLYLKLLEDAVLEQQGQPRRKRVECSADLTVSAHIPERYVPSAQQRMDLYRRIAAIAASEDADDLTDELLDRYGELPAPVRALLDVALLRAAAAAVSVCDITQKGRQLLFSFADTLNVAGLMALCTQPRYRNRLLLGAGKSPRLTLYLREDEDALAAAGELVEQLKRQSETASDAGSKEEHTL